MPTGILSLDTLSDYLVSAEKELAKATAARIAAHQNENSWATEVTSLRNLIEVRRTRIVAPDPAQLNLDGAEVSIGIQPVQEPEIIAGPSSGDVDKSKLSHLDWIELAIRESGGRGMTPPQVFQKATNAERHMHRNYPYTALRDLLEKKRIIRRGAYYYAPEPISE